MSDLKDDLTDLTGVGDATAESVLEVLAEHDTGERNDYVRKAIDAAHAGDEREAAVYLRRGTDAPEDA